MTRTIKSVQISIPSIKGYSRHVSRVVECLITQRGYVNERGVKILWESSPYYRGHLTSLRSFAGRAKAQARQIAEAKLIEALGV